MSTVCIASENGFPVTNTFAFLRAMFDMLFRKNPLYFRIGLHFFLFSPEHFEITKLLGWFWERAKYPKINPISAVVSGIPIPTKGENA